MAIDPRRSGRAQTHAFLLHPNDWLVGGRRLVGAPAVHRQLSAWLRAAGLRETGDGRKDAAGEAAAPAAIAQSVAEEGS
jgi:hypothetical protein